MLGRIVLLLLQLGVGYYTAPKVMAFIKVDLGSLQIFVYALVVAIIVWLLGVVGNLVLKDVARPSPSTLAVAVVAALIFAALTLFPDITRSVSKVIPGGLRADLYPLIGAVIGYAVKR